MQSANLAIADVWAGIARVQVAHAFTYTFRMVVVTFMCCGRVATLWLCCLARSSAWSRFRQSSRRWMASMALSLVCWLFLRWCDASDWRQHRQTERQKDRQKGRQVDRDRQIDRDGADRPTERQADRQTPADAGKQSHRRRKPEMMPTTADLIGTCRVYSYTCTRVPAVHVYRS